MSPSKLSHTPTADSGTRILVYPQGVPGKVNITKADVARLEPGEFLNDSLIEFGLKYVVVHFALDLAFNLDGDCGSRN